jgi:hypothetical protein
LWLSILAHNLGNLWRRLVLPKGIESWLLTSPQQRWVKTGGRLAKHARYYWLMLAEGHRTRALFVATLRRLAVLPLPANRTTDRKVSTESRRTKGKGPVSEKSRAGVSITPANPGREGIIRFFTANAELVLQFPRRAVQFDGNRT